MVSAPGTKWESTSSVHEKRTREQIFIEVREVISTYESLPIDRSGTRES